MQLKKNGHDASYQERSDDDTDLSSPESADVFADLAPSQPRYQRERPPVPAADALPQAAPASLIDANSSFDGRFETAQDLRVEGSASGEIVCRGLLTIERDASVRASIESAEVLVRGRVDGDIVCAGRLIIAATAVVSGTLRAGTLVVEEGATLSGSIQTAGAAQEGAARPGIVTRVHAVGERVRLLPSRLSRSAVAGAKCRALPLSQPLPRKCSWRATGTSEFRSSPHKKARLHTK
jgi:cytoskeletal protein CcmA (bactofilin family)